jgi:membrane-associated phospholipid phosphatase
MRKKIDTTPSEINQPRRRALAGATAVLGSLAVARGSAQTAAALSQTTQNAVARSAIDAANFSKSLPHDGSGAVNADALRKLEAATQSGRIADWEALPLTNEIRLVNPLAAFAWETDPLANEVIQLPPFPKLDSIELAEQALELYWMALLRDVPLWDYTRSPLVRDALLELRKTNLNAHATAENLFRLNSPGERSGHYLSQYLWMTIPYGAHITYQKYRTIHRGVDFMTKREEYVRIANGQWPAGIANHYADDLYLRTGRDLGEYVHWDFSYQAFIDAASIIIGNPHRPREALARTNPYKTSRSMNGFVSLGPAFAMNAMGAVSDCAMRACWYEKWIRHRALRPEAYGALVDRVARGESAQSVGIHPMIAQSDAVKRVREKFGSTLLPQAYPEGSPGHPAYPSGHAAIAGACVTVLKALFDEKREIRFPVQATRDGTDWEALDATLPKPTVGSELSKLAANVAMGRNFAGIHWRSDAEQGLRLGESVALAWLKAERVKSVEGKQGWLKDFELTDFAGKVVKA